MPPAVGRRDINLKFDVLLLLKHGGTIVNYRNILARPLWTLLVGGWIFMTATNPSSAREFGGYECTQDCSGHKAGYEWAEAKEIEDEAKCEAILRRQPNRISFYEGCLVYVEDPTRGSDEDDDGDEIE
jgi:hypothetical protein